jgi:hypothetical protein
MFAAAEKENCMEKKRKDQLKWRTLVQKIRKKLKSGGDNSPS